MRSGRMQDRSMESSGVPARDESVLRRRRAAVMLAGFGSLLVLALLLAWLALPRGEQPGPEPTPAVRLDRLEDASLRCADEPAGEWLDAASWPPASERDERRRFVMAEARRLLRGGSAVEAIELLDREERAEASMKDPAWRSLRLTALRAAGRDGEAESELSSWMDGLAEEDPERAWAASEVSLHLAVTGRIAECAEASASWLGRTLTPAPLARFRMAEAIVRSELGDHAVAAAALAGALLADRSAAPRERLPCGVFARTASELASAALLAGSLRPAIDLSNLGLELLERGSLRQEFLRMLATASRSEAMRLTGSIAALGDAVDPAVAAERQALVEQANRRFLTAASSAQELAHDLAIDSGGTTPALRAAAMHLAAECWELSGRVDQAVAAWREWLLWRPDSDPQRAEVLWRIAELLHGLGRFTEAVDAYRMLLRAHPNSPQAAKAPVAAARALRAMGETDQAVEILEGVLAGRGGIDPESPAFMAALIERGRLAHALSDFETARRRLDEALRRDRHHPDALELSLLLADAWRHLAIEQERRAAAPGATSLRLAAGERAREAWTAALEHFAEAVARLDLREGREPTQDLELWSRFGRTGLAASLEALGRLDEARTAWEEVDRRHAAGEASLVALDRLRRIPSVDADAVGRRALRRIDAMEAQGANGDGLRLLSLAAWRQWFGADGRVLAGAGGAS